MSDLSHTDFVKEFSNSGSSMKKQEVGDEITNYDPIKIIDEIYQNRTDVSKKKKRKTVELTLDVNSLSITESDGLHKEDTVASSSALNGRRARKRKTRDLILSVEKEIQTDRNAVSSDDTSASQRQISSPLRNKEASGNEVISSSMLTLLPIDDTTCSTVTQSYKLTKEQNIGSSPPRDKKTTRKRKTRDLFLTVEKETQMDKTDISSDGNSQATSCHFVPYEVLPSPCGSKDGGQKKIATERSPLAEEASPDVLSERIIEQEMSLTASSMSIGGSVCAEQMTDINNERQSRNVATSLPTLPSSADSATKNMDACFLSPTTASSSHLSQG